MAEEGVKREGTEHLGLPPRKRFKVMEQQRKMEVEEEEEEEEKPRPVDSHCSDITNVMPPLHRVSPKKLTSQGFLVLEKRKYKLQQQKLQENLVPAMPPLPPRPVAVKRKEAPALPLPAPPAVRLKFQREKVHSPSSSAFKSWGSSSPKKIPTSDASPVAAKKSNGSPRDSRKEQAPKPKRHHQESLSAPPIVQHAKTWTMAPGTTCSVNKAQEDVEMVVCEAPVLSSDEDVVVSTSSAPMEPLDLNATAEVDNEVRVGSGGNMVEASHVVVGETKPVTVASVPIEDVVHAVEGVGDVAADPVSSVAVEDIHVAEESHAPLGKTTTGVEGLGDVAADPVSSVVVEDIHVAEESHAPLENTTTVVEAAHVGDAQAHDGKEVVEKVNGSTLEIPVDQTDLAGAGESTLVDASETLLGVREVEEEPEADAEKDMAVGAPEACFPDQLASPLATGSSTVVLAENRTDSETSDIVKASEDLAVAGVHKEENAIWERCDKADCETSPAKKCEEQAALSVAEEMEVDEDKERVVATTLRDSLAGTEGQAEQAGLLAEIDERAEKIFKRMFERESYGGCDDEEHGSDAQFFFAPNGVNNFNSLVTGMEVDDRPASRFQDLSDSSTPKQKNCGSRVVDVSSLEDHQIYVERPTVHVPNKPPEEITREMSESSSRASEGHEDSVCSDDQETGSPIPAARGSMKLQDIVCKSSKEDSDWDLDVEIPKFGFGKRSGGMTQRVKAPGRWSQSSEVRTGKLKEVADEEAGEDEDEGACDVCRSADAKPSDPIVYCDGCDIPVHADCYGNPLSHVIPEGDWFCAQCQSKRPDSRNCCLCPRTGGVMKMTTDGNWAHLSCAVFVPEVFFRNADDMEGIDTSHVPSKRYLAKCCVCKSNGGACVDCTEIGCKSRFHVSCALKKDLAMEFRNGRSGAIVISFCQEHTAAWDEQQERKGRSKYKIVSREPQKTKVLPRSKSR